MAITREKKVKILADLIERLRSAKSVFFSKYQGVDVKGMHMVRRKLREEQAGLKVVKKTLLRKAAKTLHFPEIPDELLEGQVAVAYGMKDEIIPAKILHTYSKENPNLQLLGGILEGKILSAGDAKAIAQLPGHGELIAHLVYVLKSPLSGFHQVLSGVMRSFVLALSDLQKKRS